MKPFRTLNSTVIPLPYNDVDTDQIIPAVYLKVTDKNGLAEGLFARWRYASAEELNPDFPLNKACYQDAQILLAGDNFGCGSSREHAPWALLGWGIRAVISTSFADIFRNNALKNGLLPVAVDAATHRDLLEQAAADTGFKVRIDLENQTLTYPPGKSAIFPIDAFSKHCLLAGVDQLGFLLEHEAHIADYERMHTRW